MRQCLLVTNQASFPLDGSWRLHNLQAYFWCSKSFFFSVLIISQAGKWAISPLPLPLFVAHLLGRNGRGKGKAEEEEGGGSFDRRGFVSVLHLPRSWPVFILDRACNGRDKSPCVFVGGCGQRERATGAEKFFRRGLQQGRATGSAPWGRRVRVRVKGWGGRRKDVGWDGEDPPCAMAWRPHQAEGGQCHSSGGECPTG